MPRRKKVTATLKEPVKIRFKDCAGGVKSVYLDIYYKGKRQYDYLRMYLQPETTPAIKRQNEAILAAAEAIKSQRIIELTNNAAGLKNTSIHSKRLLVDWMQTYYENCVKRGHRGCELILNANKVLKAYKPKVRMGDLDRDYCLGLKDFLCTEYKTKLGNSLAPQTVINYIGCLRGALNEAVRADIIGENPLNRLTTKEKVKAPESQRTYLTIEEVKKLETIPCKHEMSKRAFLFSCYSGLRLSDVKSLRWKDLQKDGGQWKANIVMFKTRTPLYLPLSQQALRWMPERGDATDEDRVFAGMVSDTNLNLDIKKWVKSAGISKNVTYHTSRHTHATMLLTLGVDLYTVSKLLGHSKIETTQIYAKIVDSKKIDAINLVDKAFELD